MVRNEFHDPCRFTSWKTGSIEVFVAEFELTFNFMRFFSLCAYVAMGKQNIDKQKLVALRRFVGHLFKLACTWQCIFMKDGSSFSVTLKFCLKV